MKIEAKMKLLNIAYRSLGLIFSILVPLAFGLYSIKLGQDTNWDLLNYHLYNPYAYLHDRLSYDLAPAGLQTYFNPFLDLAYLFMISKWPPNMVGFLIGLFQGLNFVLIYGISRHVLKEHKSNNVYALLLTLAAMFSVGFLSEVGTTLNDSLTSVFPLLSLWMIIAYFSKLKDGRSPTLVLIVFSGVIAGIGCGLKLVTAIYSLALCLSLLSFPVPWLRKLKLSIFFGLSVLLGLLVSNGYWLFNIWHLFGNPLFPQYNDVFHGVLAKFEPIRDIRFLPKTIFDKIFYPFLFTVNPLRVAELRYEQVSWLFAYIAALSLLAQKVAKFFKRGSDQCPLTPETSFLLTFFCISYFLWLNIFGIYRYLIPIELLIPLLLFVATNHFFKTKLAQWAAIFFVGAITLVNLRGVPDFGHSAWSENIYHVEPNVLSMAPEPAAVYLAGQPLAWLVPALDIKAPVIQLAPNIPVSEEYWKRAKILVAGRGDRSFLVLESDNPALVDRAKTALAHIGLVMDDNSCNRMTAYLGTAKFEYRYCEVKTESNQ